MISALLIPLLQTRFPGRGLRIGSPPAPCAVFPAAHPKVGDLQIYDDGDELTVVLGRFTHGHFSNYDERLTNDQKAAEIAEAIVAFLEQLFADEVILWGSHEGGGGWCHAGIERDPLPGWESEYVWSGPL
jgi:hypothetical protein